MTNPLPYSFDLFYDIKTHEDLSKEVDFLLERLKGIAELCRDIDKPIDAYITMVLDLPGETND